MTHFWIPKLKIVESTFTAPKQSRVAGYFRIRGFKDDGRSRIIAPWQPNLITTAGLEYWATGAVVQFCVLGSSNTVPTILDTTLGAYLATHDRDVSQPLWFGANNTEPYYGWHRWTFRFLPRGVDNVIREVGFGWSDQGNGLWSRALTKNESGVPIDVSWLEDEYVDVDYECRHYPFLTNTAYSTTIGGVTHTGTVKASLVTTADAWCFHPGGHSSAEKAYHTGIAILPVLFNGTVSADITGSPTGVSFSATTQTADCSIVQDPYYAGSRKHTCLVTYGPDSGVLSGGVSAVLHYTTVGAYQFSLSPPVNKLQDWTWEQHFETPTWDRYTA